MSATHQTSSTGPRTSTVAVRQVTIKRLLVVVLALGCIGAWLMPMHLRTSSLGAGGVHTDGFSVCAPLWRTGGSPSPSAYDDDDHGGVSAAQQKLAGDSDNPYTSAQMWDEIHRACDRQRQNRQVWVLMLLAVTGAVGLGWRP